MPELIQTETQSFQVSRVDNNVISLRLELGKINAGSQSEYISQPGDTISGDYLYRDGALIGEFVGKEKTTLFTYDTYEASPLENFFKEFVTGQGESNADQLENYTLLDSQGNPLEIVNIFRKDKVIDTASLGQNQEELQIAHTINFEVKGVVEDGDYAIAINHDGQSYSTNTTITELDTRSEAIHLTHTGFRPDDNYKAGFVSAWLGENLQADENSPDRFGEATYEAGTTFQLVNDVTGQVAYEGQLELAKPANETSNWARNFNLTDVMKADFSDFNEQGRYRMVVDGLGSSAAFEIGETVWTEAFEHSMKGFYNLRSGIELEAEYGGWDRPRTMHPDDGTIVYQSTAKASETDLHQVNLPNAYDVLQNTVTDEVVPEAWGGWHDAGDFDRRTQHAEPIRRLLELYEMNPEFHKNLQLSIPEQGDAIPDVINEALWGLDLMKRLQLPDGGVRGTIETIEFTGLYSGGWDLPSDLGVFAPDAFTSYTYAGLAARAAVVLEEFDVGLAAEYRETALKAIAWAETNATPGELADLTTNNARNLAAIELYRLTEDSQWHDLFAETTQFKADADWSNSLFDQQLDAAFVYTRLDSSLTDATIDRLAAEKLFERPGFLEIFGERGAFGSLIDPWPGVGYGASPSSPLESIHLVRAYHLTQDETYLQKMIADTQFGMGANPDNMTFTTGLGWRNPLAVTNVDAEALGSPAPDGLGIYGLHEVQRYGSHWSDWQVFDPADDLLFNRYTSPLSEGYQGYDYHIPTAEFTVQQTVTTNAYVWGALAAIDPGGAKDFRATALDEELTGSQLNDRLDGARGDDTIRGLGGDDLLIGSEGSDRLFGDEGNDRFLIKATDFGQGEDAIDGGSGDDTVAVEGEFAAFSVDTASGQLRLNDDTLIATVSNVEQIEFSDGVLDWATGEFQADAPEPEPETGLNLIGTEDADKLVGSEEDDIISGLGGSDRLFGQAGDDKLFGGAGQDRLFGGEGNDRLFGEDGHDRLQGNAGDDLLVAGTGDDKLLGGEGNDVLFGQDGHDRLSGQAGDDELYSDAGNDRLSGGEGADKLFGGAGQDKLSGNAGDDKLFGEEGHDHLRGNAGNDLLVAGTGDDKLVGGEGNDVLFGQDGHDRLLGQSGNDLLYGGAGHDRLSGGDGDDQLFGADGHDKLFGGAGDDILRGGLGSDQLWGGQGADVFILAIGEGQNELRDFNITEDFIGLTDGLSLGQIDITQAGNNAIIADDQGGILATVKNTSAVDLMAAQETVFVVA